MFYHFRVLGGHCNNGTWRDLTHDPKRPTPTPPLPGVQMPFSIMILSTSWWFPKLSYVHSVRHVGFDKRNITTVLDMAGSDTPLFLDFPRCLNRVISTVMCIISIIGNRGPRHPMLR